MNTTNIANPARRQFIRMSLAAGAIAAAGILPRQSHAAHRRRWMLAPKSILILGGTGFLGPHITEAARARGHKITHFNRGITEKRKQITVDAEEKLLGDRDPTKGDGLKALEGRTWDAVVDTSGYFPRIVKASAELLAKNVKQYIFISTLSVYAGNATPGTDESDALATIADATVETMGQDMSNYGPLKALCEKAAEGAMPGKVTNIRPGYIVGPGDPTDRFTYWPVRVAAGEDVLVPGAPTDPVQFIDARDLAQWIIHCIENNVVGAFNAIGPSPTYTAGEMLKACQSAANLPSPEKPCTLKWVGYDFLQKQGLEAGTLPILLPATGEYAGFHTRRNAKAVAAGLKFRSTEQTCRDILAWWPKELERRAKVTKDMIEQAKSEGKDPPQMPDPAQIRAGIPRRTEDGILKAWAEAPSTSPVPAPPKG